MKIFGHEIFTGDYKLFCKIKAKKSTWFIMFGEKRKIRKKQKVVRKRQSSC